MCLIDRLVVKEFDEDDKHRMADSVNTAFYEGEGEVYVEVNGASLLHFSNRFELDGISFEEPFPIYFLSTTLLVPALPVKDFHWCSVLMRIW